MIKIVTAAIAAALMLSPVMVQAQNAPPPYGPGIDLETARKAVAAAEAEAKKNNWQMAIAVVDSGGQLVTFSRMDNTQLKSTDIAMGKATTANNLKRPTKAIQDTLAQGGASLRFLAVPGVMPIEGGVPILVGGKIVGAIGVSGAAANQDAQCATAGAEAVGSK